MWLRKNKDLLRLLMLVVVEAIFDTNERLSRCILRRRLLKFEIRNIYVTMVKPGMQIRFLHWGVIIGQILPKFAISRVWGYDFFVSINRF